MEEILLYRLYIQKRTQWDDAISTVIYVMPINDNSEEVNVYRYEVDSRYADRGVFSTTPIWIDKAWFFDYHELVVEPKTTLGSMLDVIKTQLYEANQNALRMSAFYRKMKAIVDKSTSQ